MLKEKEKKGEIEKNINKKSFIAFKIMFIVFAVYMFFIAVLNFINCIFLPSFFSDIDCKKYIFENVYNFYSDTFLIWFSLVLYEIFSCLFNRIQKGSENKKQLIIIFLFLFITLNKPLPLFVILIVFILILIFKNIAINIHKRNFLFAMFIFILLMCNNFIITTYYNNFGIMAKTSPRLSPTETLSQEEDELCRNNQITNCKYLKKEKHGQSGYKCVYGCKKIKYNDIGKPCKDDLECQGHCAIKDRDNIINAISTLSKEKIYNSRDIDKDYFKKETGIEIGGWCKERWRWEESVGANEDIYVQKGTIHIKTEWGFGW